MIISAAMGVAQGAAESAEQDRQHAAQVAAVNRSNQIARQKYLNDIQISAYNDQKKQQVFEAKLRADAESRNAYYKQREINQVEANRASEAAQQEVNEKITEAAFESQANMAKAIQAQGTVLASGQAGGSMLLELQQAERELGFEQAQINATLFDANKAFAIDQFGVDLDLFSADTNARNQIQTTAAFAPSASFKTLRPIKQQAPSKPSKLGPILSGISTAFSTGTTLGGSDYWSSKPFFKT